MPRSAPVGLGTIALGVMAWEVDKTDGHLDQRVVHHHRHAYQTEVAGADKLRFLGY